MLIFLPIEVSKSVRNLSLFCLFILISSILSAQSNADEYQVNIKRAQGSITVDGVIDEQDWMDADVADDWWQRSPRDDVKAHWDSEARLTYDDNNLYVAIKCYDSTGQYVVQSLKRDEKLWEGDGAVVIIDPIGERTSGFMFGSTTAGAQTDVQIGGGTGFENYKEQWDNKWAAETHHGDGYWSVEMAIPFKTLRYSAENTRWLINFARADAKSNQTHIWTHTPRQFWSIDLGYAGTLVWDAPPPKSKSNIAVIPYVSAGSTKDFESGTAADNDLSVGVDAKIAVTPSLNLDVTVNPDFSQVEVDRQVTNLTRFSIFLPERRNFFLENSDVFSGFGTPFLRPFFSRRIGLSNDGTPVPIYGGARLSGNLTDDMRIGLLNVHTGSNSGVADAENYFTAAISQRVLSRSKISGFFTNRQGFDGRSSVDGDYGRNAGLEVEYQSPKGDWKSWGAYYHSFKPDIKSNNTHARAGVSYAGKVLNTTLAMGYVDTDFYADVGFVNRIHQYNSETGESIRQGFSFLFFPVEATIIPSEQRLLQSIKVKNEYFTTFNPDMKLNDLSNELSGELEFTNSAKVKAGVNYNKVRLWYPFAFTDGTPLPADVYEYTRYNVGYESDRRKLFNYKLGLSTGGFYNGTRDQVTAELNYRVQPWGRFGVIGEYNNLEFPEDYGTSELWLVGTEVEFAFSRDLFWSTFFQYNTQSDNFNINSRIQWQFKPLSWFYLVYTDNYLTPAIDVKSRSLVFKVNYWLNL